MNGRRTKLIFKKKHHKASLPNSSKTPMKAVYLSSHISRWQFMAEAIQIFRLTNSVFVTNWKHQTN